MLYCSIAYDQPEIFDDPELIEYKLADCVTRSPALFEVPGALNCERKCQKFICFFKHYTRNPICIKSNSG